MGNGGGQGGDRYNHYRRGHRDPGRDATPLDERERVELSQAGRYQTNKQASDARSHLPFTVAAQLVIEDLPITRHHMSLLEILREVLSTSDGGVLLGMGLVTDERQRDEQQPQSENEFESRIGYHPRQQRAGNPGRGRKQSETAGHSPVDGSSPSVSCDTRRKTKHFGDQGGPDGHLR